MKLAGIRMAALGTSCVLSLLAATGCGLVLQGRYQRVRVSSTPGGATASLGTDTLATPATFDVRRHPETMLLSIKRDAYYSACRFMAWEANLGFLLMDGQSVVPLLIDSIAATTPGEYQDIDVVLDPIPDGYPDVPLPDELLRDAWLHGVDLCYLPKEAIYWVRLKARFGDETMRVVASPDDSSRPYAVLAQVDVRFKGTDQWALGFGPTQSGIRSWYHDWFWGSGAPSHETQSGFAVARQHEHTEPHADIDELLKLKALALFGDKVDALLKVQHQELPANGAAATGLAVHFHEQAPEPDRQSPASEHL